MGTEEFRERLTKIETLLTQLIDKLKDDQKATENQREKCNKRLTALESYVVVEETSAKVKSETVLSKSSLSNMSEIVRTVVTIVTILVTMKVLHF